MKNIKNIKKFKKLLILSVSLFSAASAFVAGSMFYSSFSEKRAIDNLNENCYDISFDLTSKKAVVDGKETDISDLFSLSEDKVNEMIENDSFESFISSNLVGDISNDKISGNQITLQNPYSTKSLIVQTENEKALKNNPTVKEIKKINTDLYIVKYDSSQDTKNSFESLSDDESILHVMKDYKVYAFDKSESFKISPAQVTAQSVPESSVAWGVTTTGLGHYKKILDSDVLNDKQVRVAVLDTGINKTHEAFTSKSSADRLDYTYAYNYIEDNDDPVDDKGHGTQAAGAIVESTPDNVKIVPIRIMDATGVGNVSTILDAIENVYQNVDIINLSLGTAVSEFSSSDLKTLESFYKKIYDSGTIVVCSAGNESSAVCYPACSKYTLAVSSLDSELNFSSDFSNYGDEIDFAMPGSMLKLPNYSSDSAYVYASGTSFSCPFLSAAVADVLVDSSISEEKTFSNVLNVLKENSVDLGEEGKDPYYGYGMVNFDSKMFSTPYIYEIYCPIDGWVEESQILVKAVSNKPFKQYAITTENDLPQMWLELPSELQLTDLAAVFAISQNETYYVWLKNDSGYTSEKITIENVDCESPQLLSYSTSKDGYSLILEFNATDNQSGIKTAYLGYKKNSDEDFNIDEASFNSEKTLSVAHRFSVPDINISYDVYIKLVDTVGNESETIFTVENGGEVESYNISVVNKTKELAYVTIGGLTSNVENDTFLASDDKVNIVSELPCVVVYTNDNGSHYVKPTAIATNESDSYDYVITLTDNTKVFVLLKGDVDQNGKINVLDDSMINRSKLSSNNVLYSQLNSMSEVLADLNGDGKINVLDASLITRSSLSENNPLYLPISW